MLLYQDCLSAACMFCAHYGRMEFDSPIAPNAISQKHSKFKNHEKRRKSKPEET